MVAGEVASIIQQVEASALRVKQLGNWPAWVSEASLAQRIPKTGDANAPGFDAGIACALNLIQQEKQRLAATLHAAYTPEAVEQVRQELAALDPESETCWWLSACSICEEGGITQEKFLQQINTFKTLAADPEKRKEAAKKQFEKMAHSFSLSSEFGEDVPYGTEDGCIQAAYISGHPFGVHYTASYGIYFIGTYKESLGLENFSWSDETDESNRAKSGPVFGSRQFVKCANKEELKKALEMVKKQLLEK